MGMFKNAIGRVKNAAKSTASAIKAAAVTSAGAVKTAAVSVAGAVKTAAVSVARTVTKTAKKIARVAKKATKAVAQKTRGTRQTVKLGWRFVVRPFLKGWGQIFLAIGWVTALLIAPVLTLFTTFTAGWLLVGLAMLVQMLDEMNHPLTRAILSVIEIVGQLLRAAFYIWAFTQTVSMAATPVGAIILFVDFALALRKAMRKVATYSDAAHHDVPALMEPRESLTKEEQDAVMYSDLDVPTVTRRQKTAVARITDEELAVDIKARERAMGIEETVDLPACDACGDTATGMRIRSHAPPVVTAGTRKGAPHPTMDALLCSSCYEAECEDLAIAWTGVSLTDTNVEVPLLEAGLKAQPEYAASFTYPIWVKVPTLQWRDKKLNLHDRAWSCLFEGKVVATVRYDYRRQTFITTVNDRYVATRRSKASAIQMANVELDRLYGGTAAFDDTFNDSLAHERHVRELGGGR